jgi:hypothetical protein
VRFFWRGAGAIPGYQQVLFNPVPWFQKAAAPELVRAGKDGAISINAAGAVATLPQERQAAAVAGGRKGIAAGGTRSAPG